MKLTVTIILVALMQVSASSVYSQTKLNLKVNNTSIESVLQKIEEQSEYFFLYNNKQIDVIQKINIDVTGETIEDVLEILLKETGIHYLMKERQIVLYSGDLSSITNSVGKAKPGQQQKSVSGKVTDNSGQSLPGVSVIIKGIGNGTVTDLDGNYSLSNIPADAVLQFSFVGMKTQEISVEGKTSILITMQEETIGIDEVVAIGYGVKARKDLTGSVESIKNEDIEKRSVSNVTELLRGTVSGLNTQISTSPKGNSGNILIRGKTSLKANNSPLVVLDGMIYSGDIADINPIDVESIDILKDASSAAVFGARSASGVIMITTKKGKKGEPTINVSSSVGFSYLKDRQKLRSPEKYIKFRTDYFEISDESQPDGYYYGPNELPAGLTLEEWRNFDLNTSGRSDNEIWLNRLQMDGIELKNYEAGKTTDWFDQIFRIGLRQDYAVNISGGTDNTRHFVSLDYMNNQGFIVGQQYESFRTRFNLDTKIADFLTIGINSQFSHDNSPSSSANLDYASKVSPYGDKFNDDGTLKIHPHNDQAGNNPFYYKYSAEYNTVDRLLGNIFAEIKLSDGLKYRMNWINDMRWGNIYTFSYTTAERAGGGGKRTDNKYYTYNIDHILTWEKVLGDSHKLDATFLYNIESNSSYSTVSSSKDFVPDEILGFHQLSYGTNPSVSDNDLEYKGDALLGRVNYSLMNKYLFTFSVRRDGYSAFGANNKRATFPSGAFAWRISEENFFNVDWINNLKMRVSWGVNGNRDIPLYQANAALSSVIYIYSDNGTKESVSGYTSSRMSNVNLKWEKTEAFNIGLDFSLWDGILSGTLEGYRMMTRDLLIDRSLPTVSGYSLILSNLGKVQNKGIEVTLKSLNVTKPNFTWNTQLVFSMNRNKIKSLYGDMEDIFDENGKVIGQKEVSDYANGWFIGEDIDRYNDFVIDGVYQVEEAEEAAKFGLTPGSFKIKDLSADGKIESRKDEKFLGYSTPRERINLNNNLIYKNFELFFSLDAQLGHSGIFNGHFGGGYGTGDNWEAARLNGYDYPYWTPENRQNKWGKVGSINPYGANYYDSKSFVRFQNVTFSYNIPGTNPVLQSLKIQKVKLSCDVSNLAVLDKWNVWDPETSAPTPMLSTFRLLLTL